jgi:hypothetical protein
MIPPPVSDQPASNQRRELIQAAVATLVSAAVIVAVVPTLRVPAHVDRLTVENPHPWAVTVVASNHDRDGWHAVGALERDSEHMFREVIDQGDQWTFRFRYAGEQADLRVTSAQLEEDAWRITVPDELAADLRSARVAETPR